jgi:hypothetical protein
MYVRLVEGDLFDVSEQAEEDAYDEPLIEE